jgi:hypothetical protein
VPFTIRKKNYIIKGTNKQYYWVNNRGVGGQKQKALPTINNRSLIRLKSERFFITFRNSGIKPTFLLGGNR